MINITIDEWLDTILIDDRTYYERNKERLLIYNRNRYELNKEKCRAAARKRYKEKKGKEKQQEYRKKNQPEMPVVIEDTA